MNLSLCITTYNRYDMTVESFARVIGDPRIDDIVICDDHSIDGSYEKLMDAFCNIDKVNIVRKLVNTGMSLNKRDAISHAKNEWCILLDSDNIIGIDYINAFYKLLPEEDDRPNPQLIYCPDFARPNFCYTSLSGKAFTATMVAYNIMQDNALNMAMNTCNYIVNRDRYLAAYVPSKEHKASDTIWFNYNWLKVGGAFYFVPGMQYEHRVHAGSGFMQDAAYNMQAAEHVRKLISKL